MDKKSNEKRFRITDAKNSSVDGIVELVEHQYLSICTHDDSKGNYYCGITNDLGVRMDAHRREGFSIDDDKVYAWDCGSYKVAAEVEAKLDVLGFNTGNSDTVGNGGVETSTIVYMYKKGERVGKK